MGNKSFIDSVLKTLDIFYGEVVQHLREWQPSAPRLQNKEMEKEYSDSPDTAADTKPEPTSDPADIPDGFPK